MKSDLLKFKQVSKRVYHINYEHVPITRKFPNTFRLHSELYIYCFIICQPHYVWKVCLRQLSLQYVPLGMVFCGVIHTF